MYEDHEQTAALAPRDDAGRRTTNPLPRTCRARRERRFSAQCPCGGRWSWAGPVRSSAPPTAGTATPEEIRVLWCTRNAAQVGWLVSRGPGTGFSGVQLPSADIGAKVPPPHGFGSEKLLPHAFIPLPPAHVHSYSTREGTWHELRSSSALISGLLGARTRTELLRKWKKSCSCFVCCFRRVPAAGTRATSYQGIHNLPPPAPRTTCACLTFSP